jgi:hypothetical protein
MQAQSTPPRLRHKAVYAAVLGGMVAAGAPLALLGCAGNPCATRKASNATASPSPTGAQRSCRPGAARAAAATPNPAPVKRGTGTERLMLASACGACAPKGCGPCAPQAACGACAPKGCGPCAPKAACGPCAPKGCGPCAPKAACGPCAPKGCGPCAPRSCAPCGACGPCGPAVTADRFTRPAGFCGPTAATAELVAEGQRLWDDPGLGESGMSCQTCHEGNASLAATFAEPYPHQVAMPKQMAGVDQVHADEMVQFCMVVPMQAEPLPWHSRELAALTAYTVSLQQTFNPCEAAAPGACGPCAPRGCGPCAPKAACGPCAPKGCGPCAPKGCGPCAPRKPCAGLDPGGKPMARMNPAPVRRAS